MRNHGHDPFGVRTHDPEDAFLLIYVIIYVNLEPWPVSCPLKRDDILILNILCSSCTYQVIGDEFHYLFQCTYFKILDVNFSILVFLLIQIFFKLDKLMNNSETTLLKLFLFCKSVIFRTFFSFSITLSIFFIFHINNMF